MNCTACGFASPPGMRFCGMCGARLAVSAAPATCGLCGSPATPDAVECPHCHAPLEASLARMLGQERKVITAVFGDLVGFTRRSSDRDPEEVKELIDRCFLRFTLVIEEHGGYVDKYVGDGLLALFGVPRVQEDDADRALRAAAGMQAALREIADAAAGAGAPPLQMRVGVHTGEAVVGAIAGREDRGITAIGDTVNVASRIQGACAPGAIWVTQATRDACRREFAFHDLPPIEVKGKTGLLTVYALAETQEGAGRTTRRLWPTRFVGRDAEMADLRARIEATARDRRTGLCVVVGEPGIGKTRLLRELRRALPQVSAWWSEVDPYLTGPYAPFMRLLRDRYAAGEGGAPDAAWRAVLQGVHAELGPEVSLELEAALGRLATPERTARAEDDPLAEHRERIHHAFARLFAAAAAAQPTLVCLDNLHAADASTVDVIERLAETADAVPLFLLITSRPEKHERIERLRRRGAGVLTLAPLGAEAGASIVQDVVRQTGLGERVRAQIVERAGGNPLFLEELTQAFLQGAADSAHAPPDTLPSTIPGTLFAALAARIDALAPREKQVLQMASVVGRVFWRDILAHLAGGDVVPVLDRLQEMGLIYLQEVFQFAAGEEYVFRHALVHEVVYGTILKKTRKDLHRWVADRMVETYPLDTLEQAALTGYHFRCAGAWTEAVKLYERAGELSLQTQADEDAAEYFARALEMIDTLAAEGAADPDPVRARLVARQATVLSRLGRYDEALLALDRMQEVATRREEKDVLAEADGERARVLGLQGKFAEALALAKRHTTYWVAQGNASRTAQAHLLEGELFFSSGRLEDVFMALKHAQDVYDRLKDEAGLSRCRFQLGFVYAARGFCDHAYRALEQALAGMADPDGARSLLGRGKLAVLLAERGDLPGGIAALRGVVRACEQRGLRRAESANRVSLAALLVRQGQTSPAREEVEKALAVKTRIGDRRGRALCLLNLGESRQADGEIGAALRAFAEARADAQAAADLSVEAKVRCAEARARLEIGDLARAEALFGEALGLAKGAGLRTEEGLCLLGKSRASGGGMMASLQVGKAEAIAKEIGSRALAAEVALARAESGTSEAAARAALAAAATCGRPALELQATLAVLRAAPTAEATLVESARALSATLRRPALELEFDGILARRAERAGNRKEAQAGRARAEAATRRIADGCGDPALGKAFLASERVRAALEKG